MTTTNEMKQALRELLRGQTIAALGTLHRGEPYVSMVPYALLDAGPAFLIHVSGLSPHTADMLADPRVSLLVVMPLTADVSPQALPRATIQGDAAPLAHEAADYAVARATYLARFPHTADIFLLPDFSLFAIKPRSVRFIAGFAQAKSYTGEALLQALHG